MGNIWSYIWGQRERCSPLEKAMSVVDSSTVCVAQSQIILKELDQNYPNFVRHLNHKRVTTLSLLGATGMLSSHRVNVEFDVKHYGNDRNKSYSEVKDIIGEYVSDLGQHLGCPPMDEFKAARDVLTKYLRRKYIRNLPRWPNEGEVNTALIKLRKSGSYITGAIYVAWSCVGFIEAWDEGVSNHELKVRLTGQPEIKVFMCNSNKLKEFEKLMGENQFNDLAQAIERRYLEFSLLLL